MKNVVRALVFASVLSLTASSYALSPGGGNPHPTGSVASTTLGSVIDTVVTVLGL